MSDASTKVVPWGSASFSRLQISEQEFVGILGIWFSGANHTVSGSRVRGDDGTPKAVIFVEFSPPCEQKHARRLLALGYGSDKVTVTVPTSSSSFKLKYEERCVKDQIWALRGTEFGTPFSVFERRHLSILPLKGCLCSVIGAVYADSGEDWSAFQRFVDTIGISSHIQRMVRSDYDVTHPRNASQQLAPRAKVQNQLSSDGSFIGKVTVDGVEIAGAESCRSMSEASILASHRAVQILAIERDIE
ncbi:hypothetical protein GQ44DRAFT_776601 [Phaeosphaeriaceae sp. PMI808]|nr:hypothetical protein GQ44DRAFT_776601 [Phaeosphaeriaceae sp. PMI808]